jgi:uncharacterized membrane-anchored protein YjiN (DUF445 family)
MNPAAHSGPPAPSDEAIARKMLARRRMLANALLLVMGGIFAATYLDRDPGYAIGLIRAAAEAGIVGGLADWFAVTALFRRPLGLPIPHTAVLPRSKERIGKALATFVEQSFLTEELLVPRLRSARPAHRAALWLAEPANARTVMGPVLSVVPDALRVLDDGELRGFLARVVREELQEIDLAPLVGQALQIMTQSGEADVMFEHVVDALLDWAHEHGADIDRLVQERSRWWVPKVVNRRIARRLTKEASDLLLELRDPGSETRERLRAALARQIDRLQTSEAQAAEWNAMRDRLLAHPQLNAWIGAVWDRFSAALARDLAEPEPRTRQLLERALVTFGRALADDEAMQAKIEDGLERALLHLLGHRQKAAAFMVEVVRGWDAKTITERFELVIGGDLQFIRMNGTVVGAAVGCALYVATHFRG